MIIVPIRIGVENDKRNNNNKKQISNIPIHLMVCGNSLGKPGKDMLPRDHSDIQIL